MENIFKNFKWMFCTWPKALTVLSYIIQEKRRHCFYLQHYLAYWPAQKGTPFWFHEFVTEWLSNKNVFFEIGENFEGTNKKWWLHVVQFIRYQNLGNRKEHDWFNLNLAKESIKTSVVVLQLIQRHKEFCYMNGPAFIYFR